MKAVRSIPADPSEGYDLRLFSVAQTSELPSQGRSLVIAALVGGGVHIRIFNADESRVIDKSQAELVAGADLDILTKVLGTAPFPDVSSFTPKEKRSILENATAASDLPQSDKTKSAIAKLHAALAQLIISGFLSQSADQGNDFEVEKGRFRSGAESKRLLEEWRAKSNLPMGVDLKGEAVMRTINAKLVEEKKIAAIKGHVRNKANSGAQLGLGEPLDGLTVKVGRISVKPGDWQEVTEIHAENEEPIGIRSKSELDGSFALFLDLEGASTPSSLPGDYEVRAFNADAPAEILGSATIWGAFGGSGDGQKFSEHIDVTVTKEGYQGQIEYPVITADIRSRLDLTLDLDHEFSHIRNHEISLLINKGAKWSMERIDHLACSSAIFKWLRTMVNDQIELPPPFFYGLFRTDALLFVKWTLPPESLLEISLRTVTKQEGKPDNLSDLNREWIDSMLDHLIAQSDEMILQWLLVAAEDRIIQKNTTGRYPVFADQPSPENPLVTVFVLSENVKRSLEWLRLRWFCGGDAAFKKILEKEGTLEKIVETFEKITKKVGGVTPKQLQGSYQLSKSEAELAAARLERFSKLALTKAVENPTAVLPEPVQLSPGRTFLPNLVGLAEIAKIVASGDYQALAGVPSLEPSVFDIGDARIDQIKFEEGIDSTFLDKRRTTLRILQRIFRVTQDPKEALVLLCGKVGVPFHSAAQIRSHGKNQFVQLYIENANYLFGGAAAGASYAEQARRIYAKAEERATAASLGYTELIAAVEDSHTGATAAPGANLAAGAKIEGLPNWETLFGSLDSCSCRQCASVHSPAAYLVDCLEFLKRLNVGEGVIGSGESERILTAFEVFNHRRPDIAGLDLNCENAMTPMPYIDLVCEILEDGVVQEHRSITLSISNGPISDTKGLEEALTGLGYKLTKAAIVTSDYLGWKVVRDEKILLLLQPLPKTDGAFGMDQPMWLVHELRQTRLSAEQLAAEPAYVNQEAYRVLARSTLDLALPFDLCHVETTAYLSGLELRRQDVMRDLTTIEQWEGRWGTDHKDYWHRVAAETLGLTEALGLDPDKDWELITCPSPNKQKSLWSLTTGSDEVPYAMLFRHFQRETGLTHGQVLELLDGSFVNPRHRDPATGYLVGKIHIVHPDAPEDRCNTALMLVEGLDDHALDRIHRILRLSRKQPEWSLDFIDRMIISPAIGAGRLDGECLRKIAQIITLAEEMGEDFEDVAALFLQLETRGDDPDYESWFVQNGSDGEPCEAFLLTNICLQCGEDEDHHGGGCDCTTLRSQADWFAYCLRLDLADAAAIIERIGGGGCLSISNISRVWAWARLARICKLVPSDLFTLLKWLPVATDPLSSPEHLHRMLSTVKLLKEMSLPIGEVRFLIEHLNEDEQRPLNRELPDEKVLKALKEIADAFKKAETERPSVLTAEGKPDLVQQQLAEAAGLLPDYLERLGVDSPEVIVASRTFLAGSFEIGSEASIKEAAAALAVTIDTWSANLDPSKIPPLLRSLVMTAHQEGLWTTLQGIAVGQTATEYASLIEKQIEHLTKLVGNFVVESAKDEALRTIVSNLLSVSVEETHVFLEGCTMEVTDLGVSVRKSHRQVLSKVDEQTAANGREGVALQRMYKIAQAAKTLDLDLPELQWGFYFDAEANEWTNRFDLLAWLSLDKLPFPTSAPDLVASFGQLAKLLKGLQFIRSLPRRPLPNNADAKYGAMDLLLEGKPDPAKLDDYLQKTAHVFGIPKNALGEAKQGIALNEDRLREPSIFARWSKAVAALADLGLSDFRKPALWYEPSDVTDPIHQLLSANLGRDEDDEFSDGHFDPREALKSALKFRTSDSDWLGVLKTLNDPIRTRKRDALVAYSLAEQSGDRFETADDLYDYYLIDPLMGACMPSSRIVQAHGAIQAFVQRCRMGLEAKVDIGFDGSDDDESRNYEGSEWGEWYWMKNYRVWEANRKVFLYPENWIEPELRDDKSEFYREFEQQLLQAPLTNQSAEKATRKYLEKLDEVAFLEVMAAHYQEEAVSGRYIARTEHVLHVVARSKTGDPPAYFYRKFINEKSWTPWERINLEINSDHLLLFVRNSRLYLAWGLIEEYTEEENPNKFPTSENYNYDDLQNSKGLKIQIALSEFSDGQWLEKKISREALYSDPGKFKFDEIQRRKSLTRFYVVDRDPIDPFSTEAKDPGAGFFVLCYGDQGRGDVVNIGMIGAFELSGCKTFPEVASGETKKALSAATKSATSVALIPEVKDAELVTQRWIETNKDIRENLKIRGLHGYLSGYEEVLENTPGTFRVTYPQQVSTVDRAIRQALELPRIASDKAFVAISRWEPSGVLMPFFFEDGRRSYAVIPGTVALSPDKAPQEELRTFSEFFKRVSKLQPSLEREHAKKGEGSWETLIKAWDADPNKALAKRELLGLFRGSLKLEFRPFYHPFSCQIRKEFDRRGMEGLMLTSRREWKERLNLFTDTYFPSKIPSKLVSDRHPRELAEFQFDSQDGYSSYNWEVFFHIPLLVASMLAKDNQFEEAMRWYEFIFNPTALPNRHPEGDKKDEKSDLIPQRYWLTKPFYDYLQVDEDDIRDPLRQRIHKVLQRIWGDSAYHYNGPAVIETVREWRMTPFVPHVIARGRWSAFQKATVIHYVRNLIEWGDQQFRMDTMESVNLAAQMYGMAKRILGDRPQVIAAPESKRANTARTYRELAGSEKWDDFSNAVVTIENELPCIECEGELVGALPRELPSGTGFYFCVPHNEKLLEFWDLVEDRLFKLRHCQNIDGVERQLALFAPPIDPGLLVRAFAAGLSIGDVLGGGASRPLNYRFSYVLAKAKEFTQATIAFGGGLLQALEKKEAEELSQLRSNQEIEMLKIGKEIKIAQIREAQLNLDGLRRGREVTEERMNFYKRIERISSKEKRSMDLQVEADRSEKTSQDMNLLANLMHMVPNLIGGASGFGGSPHFTLDWGGKQLGQAASGAAQYHSGRASLARSQAGQVSTIASYDRRWDDWKLQERLAERELKQIDRQILAGEVRLEITRAELRNHEKQTAHAEQVLEYVKNRKFTNRELYEWMASQLSAIYYQSYQQAYRFALKAESACNFELGDDNVPRIVRGDNWAGNRKGMLAGEKLLQDLNALDAHYHERKPHPQDNPPIPLTISLARLDPVALLQLKYDGVCEVTLDESFFDSHYPGHYMRRIDTFAFEVPAVTSSGVRVNYTVSLLKSEVRTKAQRANLGVDEVDPNLRADFFCGMPHSVSGALDGARDRTQGEQFRAFEGAGVISRWRIEIPLFDNRHLDRNSLTDAVIDLTYTSRRGGDQAAKANAIALNNYLKAKVNRLISVKDEFPHEWHKLRQDVGANGSGLAELKGIDERLPYLWGETLNWKEFDLGIIIEGDADTKMKFDGSSDFLTLQTENPAKGLMHGRVTCPDFVKAWKIELNGTFPKSIYLAITPRNK